MALFGISNIPNDSTNIFRQSNTNSANDVRSNKMDSCFKKSDDPNDLVLTPEGRRLYFPAIDKCSTAVVKVYNHASTLFGIKEPVDMPPDVKSIIFAVNDFSNSLTTNKLIEALKSSNPESAVNNLVNQLEQKANDAMSQLNSIKDQKNDNSKIGSESQKQVETQTPSENSKSKNSMFSFRNPFDTGE